MKNIIKSMHKLIIVSVMLVSNMYASAQWANINSLDIEAYQDLNFPSEQIGYAIVKEWFINKLYKTEDAGASWQALTIDVSPLTNPVFQSIDFRDDTIGYVLFRATNSQSQLGSYVYKTIDGGDTWSEVTPTGLPVGTGYADIHFVSTTEGYAATGERVFKTTDGGANWASDSSVISFYPVEIDFFNANNGIVGAADGTFAYKGIVITTTDAGQTWDTLMLAPNYSSITAVDYASATTAYAITEGQWGDQKIYKTMDNGATWDTLVLTFLTDSSDNAMDMFFLDENNGYLSTTQGYIYKTENGGNSWTYEHFKDAYLSVIASNEVSIFVGGGDSTLLRYSTPLDGIRDYTTSSGMNVFPNPCSINSNVQLSAPYSGKIVITNVQGQVVYEAILTNETALFIDNGFEKGVYFIRTEDMHQAPIKLIVR